MTTARVLPDYPGYTIARDGTVASVKSGRTISAVLRPPITGTLSVKIVDSAGKPVVRNVSQLVARAYLPGPARTRVRMCDGNRLNCHASNLEWEGGSEVSDLAEFREIPGFPGYSISADGMVISMRGHKGDGKVRELLQNLNSAEGYMQVTLRVGTRLVTRRTYVLVALAFLGAPPFPGAHVRHLDGDKLNVSYLNLAWGTALENEADKQLHGTTHRKYSTEVLDAAIQCIADTGQSRPVVARLYGVGIDAIRWRLKQVKL